jgi:nicotinate-nucleotide adenylyltransferase
MDTKDGCTMNIGIMGGTFDPVHNGHLIVAEQARERMKLDEVWFMPSYQPPHKETSPIAESMHRLSMIRLAIAGHPQFRICEIEYEREGTSYTIDTTSLLVDQYPQHQFSWIIGSDMVAYLPKWYRIDDLVAQISFIGLQRPGYDLTEQKLPPHILNALTMVDMPQIDISSTDIRRRLTEGLTVRYLVPHSVFDYIQENHLYES